MDIIVMLDKEKLPKELLEELEKNISKEAKKELTNILSRSQEQLPTNQQKEQQPGIQPDQKMFAIQTGTIVGNIYDKDFKLEYITDKQINK